MKTKQTTTVTLYVIAIAFKVSYVPYIWNWSCSYLIRPFQRPRTRWAGLNISFIQWNLSNTHTSELTSQIKLELISMIFIIVKKGEEEFLQVEPTSNYSNNCESKHIFSSEQVKGGISIKYVALMHITKIHWSIWKPPVQKRQTNSWILSLTVIPICDIWTFSWLTWGVVILLVLCTYFFINMPNLFLLQLVAFCISQNAFWQLRKTGINFLSAVRFMCWCKGT